MFHIIYALSKIMNTTLKQIYIVNIRAIGIPKYQRIWYSYSLLEK